MSRIILRYFYLAKFPGFLGRSPALPACVISVMVKVVRRHAIDAAASGLDIAIARAMRHYAVLDYLMRFHTILGPAKAPGIDVPTMDRPLNCAQRNPPQSWVMFFPVNGST